MVSKSPTVLRLDDPGASTKQFEQYAKHGVPSWGPLKRYGPWRGWGPYNELTAQQWLEVFEVLRRYEAKLTIAVTASWVAETGERIPFHQRFPEQTAVLRQAVAAGLVEIANHGLTHCVETNRAFLPRPFESNRKYHREFWEWVPAEVHHAHVKQAQDILQQAFATEVVTFVPPGNVWTEETEKAAAAAGLRYLTAADHALPSETKRNGLTFVSERTTTLFHDRELALHGISWLERLLERLLERGNGPYQMVHQFAATL